MSHPVPGHSRKPFEVRCVVKVARLEEDLNERQTAIRARRVKQGLSLAMDEVSHPPPHYSLFPSFPLSLCLSLSLEE